MKKLRIGIMGCASIAKRSVIPAIKTLEDRFDLVAIASRDSEKAKETAHLFNAEPITGYDNLVDRTDIDIVYMPLPTGLHEEWAMKLLNAGKHILVEKSFALSYDSAYKLVDIARSKKLLLMENFMFKYHTQHEWVWQQLKNNELGEIRLFRSQFGFPPLDKNNFRYDMKLGGGSLLDAGAYTVKASQYFLGKSLTVDSAILYIDPAINSDVYGNATLISETGLVSQVSFGFDNYYQCNYEFWGTTGKLVAEKAFTPKPDEKPLVLVEKRGSSIKNEMSNDNHFQKILIEFHTSVANNNHDEHLQEILSQSKTLTSISEKAIRVNL